MITSVKNYKGDYAPKSAIEYNEESCEHRIVVSKLPYGTFNFEFNEFNVEVTKVTYGSHATRWLKGYSRYDDLSNVVEIQIGEHAKITETAILNFATIDDAQKNIILFAAETATCVRGF